MKIRLAQLTVTKDIATNLKKIESVLAGSEPDEWVIFPEGMISGYYPTDENYPSSIDSVLLSTTISEIKDMVVEKHVNCLIGSALKENGLWYNASVFISKNGEMNIYKKNNLANLDRKGFTAGNELRTFEANDTLFGVQLCREIIYPEHWRILKHQGAMVVFHLNNAIKEKDVIWRNIIITRAYENQYFVVSVNNADNPQTLTSIAISPFGEVIYESNPQIEEVATFELDLSQVRNYYMEQERTDLVKTELVAK